MVDGAAGFGDTLSFGLTDKARDLMGTNGVVNHCSDAYGVGEYAGYGVGLAGTGAAWILPKEVYHFTTAANASKILAQGVVKVGSNNMWGKGVYVTRWNSKLIAKLSGAASVAIPTAGKGFIPTLLIPGTFRTTGTSVWLP